MFGNKKSFGGGVELLVVGLGNPDKSTKTPVITQAGLRLTQ